ncbi:MAG: hypothetical protein WC755_00990 [Candidatus Woesearchaeota archaeon]|jgi:hypothetical protein
MLYYYIKIKEQNSFSWSPLKQDGKIPIFCLERNAKKVTKNISSNKFMIMPISYLPTQKKSPLYKKNFVIMDMVPLFQNYDFLERQINVSQD